MSRTVPLESLCDSKALRWILENDVSLDLDLSLARRSYSSHICSVFFGEHGGVLGSVNGDVVRFSGEEVCEGNPSPLFTATVYDEAADILKKRNSLVTA